MQAATHKFPTQKTNRRIIKRSILLRFSDNGTDDTPAKPQAKESIVHQSVYPDLAPILSSIGEIISTRQDASLDLKPPTAISISRRRFSTERNVLARHPPIVIDCAYTHMNMRIEKAVKGHLTAQSSIKNSRHVNYERIGRNWGWKYQKKWESN